MASNSQLFPKLLTTQDMPRPGGRLFDVSHTTKRNPYDNVLCCDVVVKHGDSELGVVSCNPVRVTMKTPMARKATGNHLMKSTSLYKTGKTFLWFLLRSKSSMQRSSIA